ncbi:MAG: hypothetical protein PHG34_02330 [Candidatus Cloacimonetes bacterium]|jgi:hypothetical protein|nr:hypothetical protein [Candidatus Cloacimonadota bacterium]
MLNICSSGHDQPVCNYYCNRCGKVIERKYTELSWDQIKFNQNEPFRALLEFPSLGLKAAFFSIFDSHLLLLTEDRQAYLLHYIFDSTDSKPAVHPFKLSSVKQPIKKILTDNRFIYIHSGHQLYVLDWVDLINLKAETTLINCPDKVIDILRDKYTYLITERCVMKLQGTDPQELFVAPASEKILALAACGDNLIIASTTDSGQIALRANEMFNHMKMGQEIILDCEWDGVKAQTLLSLGQRYYALSLNQKTIYVGRLPGLRSNQAPNYKWDMLEPIVRIFFVKNLLYVLSDATLYRWDMPNFTVAHDAMLTSINLGDHCPSINIHGTAICAPVIHRQNDYIAIMDLWLNQQSISAGFADQLIAYSVLDNHLFVLTQGTEFATIYMG